MLIVFWKRLFRTSPILAALCLVGAILASLLLIVVLIKWAPAWLAAGGLHGSDRAQELGRVRTALLALLAGSVAVLGAYYTARTFSLNRQGQITDRFTRAVDQLGHERIDVRLGGIYALERLSRESRDDLGPIAEILTAYVREHARWPFASGSARPGADHRTVASVELEAGSPPRRVRARPTTDIQAVLTVLGRRDLDYSNDIPLKLDHTCLCGAKLEGAHLERAALRAAHLEYADLRPEGFDPVPEGAVRLH